MIGKIPKPGKSFRGCILYAVSKHEAVILDACGVRIDQPVHTISDFNMQRSMNPGLGNAVGHIALSWSPHDRDRLTPEIMVELAREYMERMKITDTQYLVTEHRDRPHPHVHIVYNRVGNDGRTISDRFQKRRNVNVCKELTLKYGYHIALGKTEVNRLRLTGADKVKYELLDAIKEAVKYARSWQELEASLQRKGIGLQYKFRSGSSEVQGISFSKGAVKFKGSQIDRSLSYGRLSQQIEQNGQQVKALPQKLSVRQAPVARPPAPMGRQTATDLLQVLIQPVYQPEEPDPFQRKRKKKRRQRPNL